MGFAEGSHIGGGENTEPALTNQPRGGQSPTARKRMLAGWAG